jgi:predicted permease
MADALVGTAVPILLLMGIGFLSRKFGVLKLGDERMLSACVYFFALPALFFVDLSETSFVAETISFILAGITPIFVVVAIYVLLYVIFRFSKNTLYLLTLSTVFGNLAFCGIPFVTFAFPTQQSEKLATLAAATIGIAAIAVSITVLEFYRLAESPNKPVDNFDCCGHPCFGCWGGGSFSGVYFFAYAGGHHVCGGCFYVGGFSLWKEIRQPEEGFWAESPVNSFLAHLGCLQL